MSDQSVDSMLQHASELLARYEFDAAHKFLRRALDLEPENPVILDALGECLLDMDDIPNAIQFFQQSVEVAPEGSVPKYMYLGQLSAGLEAVDYFEKGVELASQELNALIDAIEAGEAEDGASDDADVLRQQIAAACCAVVEIFMTDACMEDNAEAECERFCQLAMEADPGNAEVLQTLASVRISQVRPEDARDLLEQSVNTWLGADDDAERPSFDLRTMTCKLLIELEDHDRALEVVDALLLEDDTCLELYYLAALCYAFQDDAPSTAEYLLRGRAVYDRLQCDDEDILGVLDNRLAEVAEALEAAGDSIDNYVETATEGLEHIRPLTSGAGGGGSSPGASSTT